MVPVLWKYYKAKDGLFPIRLRVTSTSEGKTKVTYIETGIRVSSKQFANGRVKGHPQAQEFNLKLMALCNQKQGSKSLLEYFREYIDRPHGYYHKKKLNNVYNIIKDRNPKVSLDFLLRLQRELVAEGKHPNYIADIFVRIKSVVSVMAKSGDIEYHKNPFHHFKTKTVRTEKKRLTFEQILVLQDTKLPTRQALARDMFLVSFYQGGIRFGDLCRLTEKNVQKGRLVYLMHKTSKQRNLPLNPVAAGILKKYKSFPLDINWKEEDQSINKKNALMNKHLRAACKVAGVPEITFHTSRNSVADLSIQKKKPLKVIQEMLGHDRLTTTEAYLKNFYQEETDSALNDLFN